MPNPPSLASGSNHNLGVPSSHQLPTPEQQAAYDDALRRFETEVQSLGLPFPRPQQSQEGGNASSLQAGFNAFGQNYPPLGSNTLGSSISASGLGSHFEKVVGDIPVDQFQYGSPDADWIQWVEHFERAVQVATNALGQARLEELCLLWVSLKLNDKAQPIYDKCQHKDSNWPLLKGELAEALEDPMARRRWARYKGAYKKPPSMSLQIYKANIVSFVNRYSPALATDPAAYSMELYSRFVNGLEADWREYIEESIPYNKETLDNAYSQALKYEAKQARKSR